MIDIQLWRVIMTIIFTFLAGINVYKMISGREPSATLTILSGVMLLMVVSTHWVVW